MSSSMRVPSSDTEREYYVMYGNVKGNYVFHARWNDSNAYVRTEKVSAKDTTFTYNPQVFARSFANVIAKMRVAYPTATFVRFDLAQSARHESDTRTAYDLGTSDAEIVATLTRNADAERIIRENAERDEKKRIANEKRNATRNAKKNAEKNAEKKNARQARTAVIDAPDAPDAPDAENVPSIVPDAPDAPDASA